MEDITTKAFMTGSLDCVPGFYGECALMSLKDVGQLHNAVKTQLQDHSSAAQAIDGVLSHVLARLWSLQLEPKVARRLVRVLVDIEDVYPEKVETAIKQTMNLVRLRKQEIKLVLNVCSQLIESVNAARRIIVEQLQIFLQLLKDGMEELLADSVVWVPETQEKLHTFNKVILQTVQHLSDVISRLVWCAELSDVTGVERLSYIVSCLFCMLTKDSIPKDCRVLAGTTFGFLFVLCEEKSAALEMFCDIFTSIGSFGAPIKMGNLSLNCKETPTRELSKTAPLTFGHLCLVHGYLSCASIDHLTSQVRNFGQFDTGVLTVDSNPTSFITACFPVLCKLCRSGNQQHLAFKSLQLWYQKVNKHVAVFQAHVDFTYTGPIVQETLALVWTHADSPVDGVSECALAVFKLFLSVYVTVCDVSSQDCRHLSGGTERNSIPEERNGKHAEGTERNSIPEERNGKHAEKTARGSIQEEGSGKEAVFSSLMRNIMSMSWQVKGKHMFCASLLQYVDISRWCDHHGDVAVCLLECMSTNYMAPAATEMYKAVFTQAIKQNKEKSLENCLDWLVKGLTSLNSSTCYNTCHFWLPWALKTDAKNYQLVLKVLQKQRDSIPPEAFLRASVALFKTARNQHIVEFQQLPYDVIVQAVLRSDDELRLDGLALVCNSPKKAEPLDSQEIDVLKKALPYNLNIDSPPFRQQLQAHVRVALVRLRDGSAVLLKQLRGKGSTVKNVKKTKSILEKSQNSSEVIYQQIEFVDWLWRLCLENLHPGSCYQRLKTCLEWMWVVLDCTVYQPERVHKKGGCPEGAVAVMEYAKSLGKWQFFTSDASCSLLSCILNGTDEIRESSCQILQQFFPWPLPLLRGPHDGHVTGGIQSRDEHVTRYEQAVTCLLGKALQLCTRPKAHDADSGATLCKLIFLKYAIENKWQFTFNKAVPQPLGVSLEESTHGNAMALGFVTILVEHLEDALQLATERVLDAARQNPGHGFVTAVRYCLSSWEHGPSDTARWRALIGRCLHASRQLIDLSLDVLGGKVHSDDSAPSFEQMGVAIQEAIEESGCLDGQGLEEETALSVNHQLLMTWAWMNIRECSILYGALLSLPIQSPDGVGVLDQEQIAGLGQVFLKVLTRCRHRGAIEGCNIGFTAFCTKLLAKSEPCLHEIPKKLLNQVMMQLGQGHGMTSSVTRRSAGLPLILQSILASENKAKQSTLLHAAVTSLLAVAERDVPADPDERRDLPQVHAMNILKAVFREASLAGAVMCYLERACVVAIQGFSSTVWVLRNSATQLFSTLLNRMLGQKKTKDDTLHTTTAQELFARFPGLARCLLGHLKCATHNAHGRMQLQPTLFPVLAILSKLSACIATEGKSFLEGFLQPVETLAGSAILGVRELAAKALVPLVPSTEVRQYITTLLLSLPSEREHCTSFNLLHGKLLQIGELLESPSLGEEDLRALSACLRENSWLGNSSHNPCGLLLAKYLHICDRIYAGRVDYLDLEAQTLLSRATVDSEVQIGHAHYIEAVIPRWLKASHTPDGADRKLAACLNSGDFDVLSVTLKYLQETIETVGDSAMRLSAVQSQLFGLLECETLHCKLRCEVLHTLVCLYSVLHQPWSSLPGTADRVAASLVGLILREPESDSAAYACTVVTVLYARSESFSNRLCEWLEVLKRGSAPEVTESMRYHTALGLQLAGIPLLQVLWDTDERTTQRELMALSVVRSCVNLLVDDQSETRKAVAVFVSKLPWIPSRDCQEHLQPNYALFLLFKYMIPEIVCTPICGREFANWMRKKESASEVLSAQMSNQLDELFEAQDVNPYREYTVLDSLVTHTLRQDFSLASHCYTKEEMNVLVSDLEKSVSVLQTSNEGQGLLNVSCTGPSFVALHCMLCQVQVYPWSRSHDCYTRLAHALESLHQMEWLHPRLREALTITLRAIDDTT